ncbi:MAG: thermonuclease family protein [Phycisphaerae bacterium]|nr:thermonuclease family protein [Phycisphaerae bacterium]
MKNSPKLGVAHRWLLALLLGALTLLPVAGGGEWAEDALPKPPLKDFENRPAFEVLDVRAGNVLVVRLSGENRILRLIGLYAPKSGSAEDEARAFLLRLLQGESVYVEYEQDWPLRDRQDRFWAYAYRAPDGLFVNLELIRQGYARLSAPEPFEHQKLLRTYELWARKIQKGVWSPRAPQRVQDPPRSQPAAQRAAPAPPGQPETGAHVKVYVTKHGRKYHRKDCYHVRRGALELTLKEAKAKGYTPCSHCKPPE